MTQPWSLKGSRPAVGDLVLACAFGDLAAELLAATRSPDPVAAFLGLSQVFRAEIAGHPKFRAALSDAWRGLQGNGARDRLAGARASACA